MKHIIKIAATHVAASVALIGSFGLVYAAWNTPVNNGDSLSASRWNDLVAQIQALDAAAVPAGAVISFNLTACPTGWDEYIPARGRFVRGIDSTGLNDPDGVRALESMQSDENNIITESIAFVRLGSGSDPIVAATQVGGETHPKNIALLYCIKQ